MIVTPQAGSNAYSSVVLQFCTTRPWSCCRDPRPFHAIPISGLKLMARICQNPFGICPTKKRKVSKSPEARVQFSRLYSKVIEQHWQKSQVFGCCLSCSVTTIDISPPTHRHRQPPTPPTPPPWRRLPVPGGAEVGHPAVRGSWLPSTRARAIHRQWNRLIEHQKVIALHHPIAWTPPSDQNSL